jgi:putative exporter of polyketide antibiotics
LVHLYTTEPHNVEAATPDIYTRTLVDNRRSLIAWSVGTAAVGLTYAGFYLQVSAGGMADAVSSYPEPMREALRSNEITSARQAISDPTAGKTTGSG